MDTFGTDETGEWRKAGDALEAFEFIAFSILFGVFRGPLDGRLRALGTFVRICPAKVFCCCTSSGREASVLGRANTPQPNVSACVLLHFDRMHHFLIHP